MQVLEKKQVKPKESGKQKVIRTMINKIVEIHSKNQQSQELVF